VKLSIQI